MVPFRSYLAAGLNPWRREPRLRHVLTETHGAAIRRPTFLTVAWLVLCAWLPSSHAGELTPIISQWLSAQTNLQTWSAQVVQTRRLKTLTQPLVARGQVWFSAPNLFRWEMGQPASTIAIRQPERMLVLYPRLKRAEQFPLDASAQGPGKDILALLEAGFPRSPEDLSERFEILDQSVSNDVCTVEMQPRSATARRLMPRLAVSFSTNNFVLQGTELEFADGSSMRNEFHEAILNPEIPPALFQPEIPADFKVVEPSTR